MVIQVEDILAAVREKYIADAKKLFDLFRDSYAERIGQVMLILHAVLDQKASEKTFREARVLLKQANYVRFVPGKETVFGRASADFVKSLIQNVSDESASKRSEPMTNEEIFKEYKLSEKAQAAFLRGATIGELFVIQPDLFL